MLESTLALHSRGEFLYRYHKPRDSILLWCFAWLFTRTIIFFFHSCIGKARAQSERILRGRVLVIYLYLPLAVQLCAVSIDYECEKGRAYTYCRSYNGESGVKEEERKRIYHYIIYIYIYMKSFSFSRL